MLFHSLRVFILSSLILLIGVVAPFAGEVGVVLMHGKGGGVKSNSPIGKLAARLKGDFVIAVPEMSWSRSRNFDGTMEEAFEEIKGVIARLKAQGATKIVVGGHSMGANTALAFATRYPGLAGVLMIAPGHRSDAYAQQNKNALDRGNAFAGRGETDGRVEIFDKNQGKIIKRYLKVAIAVSWFDLEGLAVMQNSAPKVRTGTPVYWVIGKKDRLHPKGRDLIYSKTPTHPKSAYVVVSGGHGVAPIRGAGKIASWLGSLR
jgi:pimeloyl-ACP methyl ester carboxylesterase